MVRVTEDITKAAEDKSVRSIVIRGQGTVFSAGHNLKEMTEDITQAAENKSVRSIVIR